MKNYLIYFLLFSTIGFSQNYQYSLEEGKTPPPVVLPTGVNNQLEEIEYFKAYLLPVSQKANLQVALDTYGSVRLERGDYRGVNITMTSNQKLYGHPSLTRVSKVTIAGGSTNVQLSELLPSQVFLQSGGIISNCVFKAIQYTDIIGTNIMFENNTFIDVTHTQITFDCSVSGYFRNNKIIRHQSQSNKVNLVLKGNSITPSYGDVHLWTNFLTPHGDTTDMDGVQSVSFVGIDAEAWNLNGVGTKAMFYARNMGNIKITDFGGSNSYAANKLASFDIDADNVSFFNKAMLVDQIDYISPRTNMFMTYSRDNKYSRTSGTQTGTDFKQHLVNRKVFYKDIERTSLIAGQDAIDITNAILEPQHTPWDRPTWETLPDPLGANWKSERIGKPDSRAYIQNLIDTNGIAELPEGIFYIGASLKMPLDDAHGIQGQGTGKTVICGLTDDFPLISITATTNGSFKINNLTFQGGSKGIYVEKTNIVEAGQIRFMNMKYVTFRDMENAIHLYHIMGLDNNFFDHVSFVNCTKGFFQDPLKPFVTYDTSSYIDKTVFYKGQFINCDIAFSMEMTRANNLNLWVDCKFDGGLMAFEGNGSFTTMANCDFSNYSGNYVMKFKFLSLYNCKFNNNSPQISILNSSVVFIEGCQFLDTSPLFSKVLNQPTNFYVFNSIVNGDAAFPYDSQYVNEKPSGIYSNSLLNANPSLNKLLVKQEERVTTVLIDETPTPYPQLLVTQ